MVSSNTVRQAFFCTKCSHTDSPAEVLVGHSTERRVTPSARSCSARAEALAAEEAEEPLELLLHVAVARETRRGITDAAHDAQQSGDGDREERHREDDVEEGVASR
jgi:hypothetical protein